jgi:hypothetical protein
MMEVNLVNQFDCSHEIKEFLGSDNPYSLYFTLVNVTNEICYGQEDSIQQYQ